MHEKRLKQLFVCIQTEAERRRREAGVQQSTENGLGSCMYVCMYVCINTYIHTYIYYTYILYVCMYDCMYGFANI